MGSFYVIHSVTRIIVVVLSLVSLFIQTISLLLLLAREENEVRTLRKTFEVMLTLHIALMAFLLTSLQDQTLLGNAALTEHTAVRWWGVLTVLLGIASAITEKRPRRTLTAAAALFTAAMLPCFDVLWGRCFAWVFMAAALFFLLRGIDSLLYGLNYLNHHLSRLSIKETMDTMHGGVLFAKPSGRIILQNRSMLVLVHRITGKTAVNANELWEQLLSFRDTDQITKTKLDGKLLFRLPDTSWELSKEIIAVGGSAYKFIRAADVTEADRITQELTEITDELTATAGELQYILDHYEEIKSAREAVNIKSRIHDLMGQRISILNQYLSGAADKNLEISDIIPLLSDLMRDIRKQETESSETVLANMKRSFALAGAELDLRGGLPENNDTANLLLLIVREAATNAIRHAQATTVTIVISETDTDTVMTITNNGKPPVGPITEGGGISGMRRRISETGGTLTVETAPVFRIIATLPK